MRLTGKRRPRQPGRVVGPPSSPDTGLHVAGVLSAGHPEEGTDAPVEDVCADVVWLIDTGADITTVRECIGRQFDRRPVSGAYVTAADGREFGVVVQGLRAEFAVEDHRGRSRTVQANGYMAIVDDSAGDDLLGMNHLADAGATLVWDPRGETGSMRAGLAVRLGAAARGVLQRLLGG